jgi:PTS system glucitol/sorbitol-specific IIC component
METMARFADAFIGLFRQGGDVFWSLVTGIIPLLVVLMTGVNAVIALIGRERFDRVAQRAGGEGAIYWPLRYMIVPPIGNFLLSNPMFGTMGRFMPEKYKPAYWDACVSFMHPPTGLFPHINPSELFVWLGIANGVEELGLSVGGLAIRYFLSGLVVILIRGIATEKITEIMWARREQA